MNKGLPERGEPRTASNSALATSAPMVLGPACAALEKELRRRVQRDGVVAWLDADEHYGRFVDALAEQRATGRLPYEVKAWRGTWR